MFIEKRSRLYLDSSGKEVHIVYSSGNEFIHMYGSSRNSHGFLIESLKQIGLNQDGFVLDEVNIGLGPGSFTGIRVTLAIALAICTKNLSQTSKRTKLFKFSSLSSYQPLDQSKENIVIFDARSGGVYAQEFLTRDYCVKPERWSFEELALKWQSFKGSWWVDDKQLFIEHLEKLVKLSEEDTGRIQSQKSLFFAEKEGLDLLDLYKEEHVYDGDRFETLSGIEPYYLQSNEHYKKLPS